MITLVLVILNSENMHTDFRQAKDHPNYICIPSSSLDPGLLGSLIDHSGLVTLPPTQGTALGARESLKRLETCQVEHMRTREKGLSG